jgi:hypothetical protein
MKKKQTKKLFSSYGCEEEEDDYNHPLTLAEECEEDYVDGHYWCEEDAQ